jgi:type IV secretion system protein VirB8
MSADSALEAYFSEARSWDLDRAVRRQRESRLAWIIAGTGWLCAVACAAALVTLMPLKRVEPFVVRVDNSTGIVDVVPGYSGTVAPDQAITRYFLSHYITVCERFSYVTAESDYEECGAFQGAARNQVWSALWAPANPVSPLNMHRDGSLVRAQVVSVTFFDRANGVSDLAQVRYLKAERLGAGSPERVTHWIASIQYAYTAPAQDARARSWNPLGFKVVGLSAEPEVPEVEVNAAPRQADGGREP